MSNESPRFSTGNRQRATGNGQLPETSGEHVGTELSRGADIAERLLEFAAACLRLGRLLPRDVVGRHILKQLARAATSGGANYDEARAAESTGDFIHKIGVAQKEVRETNYWLRLCQRANLLKEPIDALLDESLQLAAILGASKRTALERRKR